MAHHHSVTDCLVQFRKQAKEIVEKGLNKGEANVTNFLVNPLLHCLEWETTKPEYIRPQYAIRMGTASKFVDYALVCEGKPVCLVEVKDTPLTEDNASQLLSYCNADRVRWGMLTNGVELWFYDTSITEVDNPLVFKIEILADSKKMLEILPYLRRSHLRSPDPTVFRRMILRRMAIDVAKSGAKALIQQITEWFEDQMKGVDSIPEGVVKEAIRQVFGFPSPEVPELRGEVGPSKLIATTAGDWRHNPQLGKGMFQYKRDPTKRIDVSKPGPQVERHLTQLGLRCSTPTAFNGFYYDLRKRASLIRRS